MYNVKYYELYLAGELEKHMKIIFLEEEQNWKYRDHSQDSAWEKKERKKAEWQRKKNILKNVPNSANGVVEMLTGTKNYLNTR